MKLRTDSYFFIIIMIITLAVIGWSLKMEYFMSKLLPIIVSSSIFVLAAIGLTREILANDELGSAVTEDETGVGEETRQGWRAYLRSVGWVLGFFLAIYLLGFIIAVTLLVITYMKSHGVRWLGTIVSTVLAPLFIYGIFELGLKVTLYRGLIFTWLGS